MHGFDVFKHFFYNDALAVLVIFAVALVLDCLGAHALAVGCAGSVIYVWVSGWLL